MGKENSTNLKKDPLTRVRSSASRSQSRSRSPSQSRTANQDIFIAPAPSQILTLPRRLMTRTISQPNNPHVNQDPVANASVADLNNNRVDEALSENDDDIDDNKEDQYRLKMPSVIKFFKKLEDDTYQCLGCNKDGFVKQRKGSDANLRQHMYTKHGCDEFLYPSQKKRIIGTQETFTIVDRRRCRELDKAIVDCVIQDGRSFNDFKKEGFLSFLKIAVPGYTPPCRQTISATIRARVMAYKEKLAATLAKADFLALTVDLSRAKNLHNFVTLTGHLVDCKLNLHSLIIDHCHFTGVQSANKIEKYILDKMEEINVEIDKVACITCDSGSNVKAASSRITTRISCVCHNINLIIKKTFRLFDNNRARIEIENDDFDEDEDDNELDDLYDVYDNDDNDEDEYVPWVQDDNQFWENIDNEEPLNRDQGTIIEKVQILIDKVRKLVKAIRKSKLIFDYVNHARLEARISGFLKLDFHVRWNSTFRMIKMFMKYKQIVEEITAIPGKVIGLDEVKKAKLRQLRLSQEEWIFLDSILMVLEPFYFSTVMLSAREYPTLSKTKAIENILISKFEILSSPPYTNVIIEMSQMLLENIQLYLIDPSKVSKEQRDITLIAAYLDPPSKKFLLDREAAQAEELIIKKLSSKKNRANQHSQIQTNTQRNGLENFADQLGLYNSPTKDETSIKQELNRYNISSENSYESFEAFWLSNSKLTRLFNLARRTCMIPASSVPAESSFSCANYLLRKTRQSLNPESLIAQLLCSQESKLDKLIYN